ncbi:uncharacterized protein LOC112093511 [Morus notabilis]|uniref:uncharacterized protein LOC112093511 n=1 Tax=Morus notabilis TaxID=981085 RepID=UPI000CECF035|nr:uncharacterized protein LOC112093511 [Morus notabilis]
MNSFLPRSRKTVMEYREKFELLSGRLGEISEAVLEGNFMKGLKPEIRAALRLLRPRGLGETMELAQMIEDKNTTARVNRSNTVGFSYQNSAPPGGQKTQTLGFQRETQKDRDSGVRPGGTIKHLTETEIQDKRAKGLCFQGDEKFFPGHRCKDRSLQVLTVCDDEEGVEAAEEEEWMEEEHLHLDVAEVSLNSVAGFTPNHSMKIKGRIGEQDVVVLVDSGATHNFISNRMVEKIGLQLTDTGSFGVTLGPGVLETSRGICKGLILSLQGIQVLDDFLPLDLGSTDVILRMKWLQTLGAMKVNWKLLSMKVGNQPVILRGDPSLCRTLVSLKTMVRAIKRTREVAYRLRLPPSSAIHPVFHVSQLRQAIGEHTSSSSLPPTLTEDMEVVMELSALEGVRREATGNKEVLIRWKNLPDYEAT